MSNEAIKPIALHELMEVEVEIGPVAHCIKEINAELINARKSGATTASVQIHDEEIITSLLYEYSRIGYSVQWDKYTKQLILEWT